MRSIRADEGPVCGGLCPMFRGDQKPRRATRKAAAERLSEAWTCWPPQPRWLPAAAKARRRDPHAAAGLQCTGTRRWNDASKTARTGGGRVLATNGHDFLASFTCLRVPRYLISLSHFVGGFPTVMRSRPSHTRASPRPMSSPLPTLTSPDRKDAGMLFSISSAIRAFSVCVSA